MDLDAAVEELITSPPAIHLSRGEYQSWGLGPEPLRWIAEHSESSWQTLETGCGVSTILFALKSAGHTVVSPTKLHHEGVRAWCAERGFSTDHVQFVLAQSQDVLPTLSNDPLDLVLIDGAHVLPIPFIDWYYTALRLRVGGFMMVDDMQIASCSLLSEFLASEQGRWRLVTEVDRAAVFEKLDTNLFPQGGWKAQPWCRWTESASTTGLGRAGRLRARLGRAKARIGRVRA